MVASRSQGTRHWFRMVHLLLNGEGHEDAGAAPSGFIARLGTERAFMLSEKAYRHALSTYIAEGEGPHQFRCAVFAGIREALEREPFQDLSDTVRTLVLQDARRVLMLVGIECGVQA